VKVAHFHYFVLACILAGGVAMLFFTRGNPSFQLLVGIATSVAYVFWGIIHHALAGDLHPKVVIEYMLIGGIAIMVFMTVLG